MLKIGSRVTVSAKCKDKMYRGITGRVLGTKFSSDKLVNRVSLDKPVKNACIYWFADNELEVK